MLPNPVLRQTNSNDLRHDLRQIKRLFLDKDYKECATKCAVLLVQNNVHAVEQAFLHYYAASAHELLAQPMQNFSPTKLANLYDAKQHFELALAVLDEIRPRARLSQGSRSSSGCSSQDATSPEQSVTSPETPKESVKAINFSRKQLTPSSSPDTSFSGKIQVVNVSPAQWLAGESPTATESPADDRNVQSPPAKPSSGPQHSPSPLLYPLTSSQEEHHDSRSLPTKPSAQKTCNCLLPKHNHNAMPQSSQSAEASAMDPSFKVVVPTMRCSRLATELTELIDHHISWIELAIKNVVEAHQRRIDMTASPDAKEKTVQKQAKLTLWKTNTRKRPRFDASKTQRLCKMALEEL